MNFSLGFALLLPSLQFMQKFSAKEQCKRNRENYLHFIYTRGLVYLEANAFTSDLAAVPMEFLDVRKTSSYNGMHLYDFPIVFPLPSLLIWWNELLLLYLCLSASLFLRVFPNCFSLHFGISSTPRQMACGNFLIHWWRAEKKNKRISNSFHRNTVVSTCIMPFFGCHRHPCACMWYFRSFVMRIEKRINSWFLFRNSLKKKSFAYVSHIHKNYH